VHRYATKACRHCAIKHSCTKGNKRRIKRWEHEHIIEVVERRPDEHPEKMRQRREAVPFIRGLARKSQFLASYLPYEITTRNGYKAASPDFKSKLPHANFSAETTGNRCRKANLENLRSRRIAHGYLL
jgi:hypothetical protein